MDINILVVDDDTTISSIMIELFKLNGWTTDTAENGQEGLDKVSINDYDVIFMDIFMPVMDGMEATREIMKIKPDSKIVVVSGMLNQDKVDKLLKLGALSFMSKPFDTHKVIELIESIVNKNN